MSQQKPKLEKTVQSMIVQYLSMIGIPVWRNNIVTQGLEYKGKKRFVRSGVGGRGGADLIGIVPRSGRFLAIECKRAGARTDPDRQALQDEFARQVESAGGIAVKVTSLNELIVELKKKGI